MIPAPFEKHYRSHFPNKPGVQPGPVSPAPTAERLGKAAGQMGADTYDTHDFKKGNPYDLVNTPGSFIAWRSAYIKEFLGTRFSFLDYRNEMEILRLNVKLEWSPGASAEIDGFRAYYAGLETNANPYVDSSARNYWLLGFLLGLLEEKPGLRP